MRFITTILLAAALASIALGQQQAPSGKPNPPAISPADPTQKTPMPGKAAIEAKMKSLVLPKIEFHEVSLQKALETLQQLTIEADRNESAPQKKGLKLVMKFPEGTPAPDIKELNLRNIPLGAALRYLTDATGSEITVTDSEVIVKPKQP